MLGRGRRRIELLLTCGERDPAERATQGEDEETDPRQQQRDPHHNREIRHPLSKERRVQRRRQRRLRHPHIAQTILDRPPPRVLRRQRLVIRVLPRRSQETAHLRIPLPLRRRQRVMLHHIRKRTRLRTRPARPPRRQRVIPHPIRNRARLRTRPDRLPRRQHTTRQLRRIRRRRNLLRRNLI